MPAELNTRVMAVKQTMLLRVACAILTAVSADAAERSGQTGHRVETSELRSWEAPRPAHGGDVRLAGPFWLELVVAKGSLTVYVTDRSGAPVDTSKGRGSATAHTDGRGTRIELRPAGGDQLAGKGRFTLKRSTVVFVTAHLRGEKPHRAVFRPLQGAAMDNDR